MLERRRREKGSSGQRGEVGPRPRIEDQCAFSEDVVVSLKHCFGRIDVFEREGEQECE